MTAFEIFLAGAILFAAVRAARHAIEVSSQEWNGTLASIRAVTDELGGTFRARGRELARVAWKATVVAERQIDEADRALDRARERVVEIGREFDQSFFEPVRRLGALAAGVRRGFEVLAALRARPDEEDAGSDEDSPPAELEREDC